MGNYINFLPTDLAKGVYDNARSQRLMWVFYWSCLKLNKNINSFINLSI